MRIGVPREVKVQEERVAVTPHGVREYVQHGHQVFIEQGAGEGSGFSDREYIAAGATVVPTAADVWSNAEMVVKVKEPIPDEYAYLRPGLILFTYLHLAADEALTRMLLERHVTAIAYETVQLADGSLPLLAPMSEVAGRLAVQIAAYYLMRPHGGRGVLLGGVAGVSAANVTILGGGIVGTNAAQMALGLGANVTLLDINVDRLRFLEQILHGRFHTLMSNQQHVADAVEQADVVISGVLIPGARAPKLVTREMVASMRPGAVIVDVSIDQGGSVETSRPTTHADPVYEQYGVVHYCVTNMPGSVPRTSTFALSNVTLPYGLKLADLGVVEAVRRDPALARGINTYQGKVTHPSVASALNLPYTPITALLEQEHATAS